MAGLKLRVKPTTAIPLAFRSKKMDLLRKELEKKQKSRMGGRRWVRQSELMEARQKDVELEEASKRRRVGWTNHESVSKLDEVKEPAKASEASEVRGEAGGRDIASELLNLSKDEVYQRLRRLGEPVTLYGESDLARCKRLAKLEYARPGSDDEYKLTGAYAIKNTFLAENQDIHDDDEEDEESVDDDDDDKPTSEGGTNSSRKSAPSDYKVIRRWVRDRLKEWEQELDARPESHKRAPHGRVEIKKYKQCKDYIRPLVRLCKRKQLDRAMANSLANIVRLCNQGEFVKAHDAYILIAIGNAAWPIGVTSVGIHTRTAREAVEQKNVAHVMNNEMQRKYLTSVKRLLTFAQDRRTDVPPSKKVQ